MRRVAVVLGLVLSTGGLGAQGTTVVSGQVRDETGAPVREVLVVVDPDSLSLRTRTGADGRYRITVPTGRFEVRVVRIGFRPQSHTISAIAPLTQLDIELKSVAIPLSTVAVRVSRPGLYGVVVTRGIQLLPHEPRTLRDASIELLNEPHRVKSGADGRFSIPQLGIGSHTIMVSLDRYAARMVPVTIPPEGGVETTLTLDSLYADYQFRDQQTMRDIGWRVRRARNPATFVSAHELDSAAKNLREALRFADAVLSRGIILMGVTPTVYMDGKHQPGLELQDIPQNELERIEGIEVYPEFSLQSDAGVVPGLPSGGLDGPLFSTGQRGKGSFRSRTTRRSRGNRGLLVMIWTTRRR